MSEEKTVTLTQEQLDLIVAAACSRVLGKRAPAKSAIVKDDAVVAEESEKEARRTKYVDGKKEVAIRLMKEKGVHYNLFQKGRKVYIWSDLTFDKARRGGHAGNLGTRIWSTANEFSLSGEPITK